MTKNTDPLAGEPVSPEEDALYAAWSERIEADDIHTPDSARAYEGEEAQRVSSALLEGIVGREELDRAIGRGRPALGGAAQRGESPKIQVRLTRELKKALKARAENEHRKESEVAREAIALYLRDSAPEDRSPADARQAS